MCAHTGCSHGAQQIPDGSEVKLKCWGAAGYWLFMGNVQFFVYNLSKQLKGRVEKEQKLRKLNKLGCRIQQNMIKAFYFKCSEPLEIQLLSLPLWSLLHQTLVNTGAQPCHVQYPKNQCKRAKMFLPPATLSTSDKDLVSISGTKPEPGSAQGNMEKARNLGCISWCDSDMPMILNISPTQHKRKERGRKIKRLLSDTAASWETG